MKTYDVTIRATVTKTMTVEAETEALAIEAANEQFTVVCDGGDEDYDQEVLDVEQLT